MAKKLHLPDSAAWFSVLTNHLPMVFYILDRNGVFLMSEGLGLKKLGLKPGQVVGSPFSTSIATTPTSWRP